MANKMIESLKRIFQEETLAERSHRMIPAAIYGALFATVYILTLSFVNVLTFPNLPVGMDWVRILGMWAGFGAAFALFGAIAAWFTEEYEGIVGGGVIITVLMAVVFLFSPGAWNSTLTMQSILSASTLVGVDMLAAWGLRWTSRRHLAIMCDEKPNLRRKLLTKHVLIIMLAGLIPGLLGRMDLPAERTIGQLHELLQAAPKDPSVWPHLPLRQVPELKDHFGVEYVLYPRQSKLSAGSLDVTVRFVDGFVMTCFLPVGSDTNFITNCNVGETILNIP